MRQPGLVVSMRLVTESFPGATRAGSAGHLSAAATATSDLDITVLTTTAAGTLHTKLEPLPGGDLIDAQLARQRPGLCSIDCVCGRGRFYNLGPRRHRDRLRGQHPDAPRLIRQRGALLLLVPSPPEATVPHRELPGLRLG